MTEDDIGMRNTDYGIRIIAILCKKIIINTYYCIIKIVWTGEGVCEIGSDATNGITRVKINPRYFRPCEVDFLLGDSSKARDKLGWTFEYDTIEKLIEEMFS